MTKLSIGGRLFGKDRRSDQIKEVMAMRITFTGGTLVAGIAALTMTVMMRRRPISPVTFPFIRRIGATQ